jgi:hypothetical protein
VLAAVRHPRWQQASPVFSVRYQLLSLQSCTLKNQVSTCSRSLHLNREPDIPDLIGFLQVKQDETSWTGPAPP